MIKVFFHALLYAGKAAQQGDPCQTLFITGMVLLGLAVLSALVLLFAATAKWGIRGILTILKVALTKIYSHIKKSLTVEAAGILYNNAQDVFYFGEDAWQKVFGYCRLYDEASILMGMVIDCEPIYFDYGGRHWLIEFWKGQYSAACGCEAGVYNTSMPELKIPGIFYGTLYDAAEDSDMLNMSCVLTKNGRVLFRRAGRHWWLTGFVLGEFSYPDELSAGISIVMKDREMLAAFLGGMKKAGYSDGELKVGGNTVSFVYGKPRTAQPYTRTHAMEAVMQKNNKYLCERFSELTKDENGASAKLDAVQKLDPSLYEKIIDIGGTKKILGKYEALKIYLSKAQ